MNRRFSISFYQNEANALRKQWENLAIVSITIDLLRPYEITAFSFDRFINSIESNFQKYKRFRNLIASKDVVSYRSLVSGHIYRLSTHNYADSLA